MHTQRGRNRLLQLLRIGADFGNDRDIGLVAEHPEVSRGGRVRHDRPALDDVVEEVGFRLDHSDHAHLHTRAAETSEHANGAPDRILLTEEVVGEWLRDHDHA